MPFRYLGDPLFLACVVIYFAHRGLVYFDRSPWWLRSYLNDLICIPFWTPPMLWAVRLFGTRKHNQPPQAWEVLVLLFVIAISFELIIPFLPAWHGLATSDPFDIFFYCLGAYSSMSIWQWYYRDSPRP